MTAALLVVFVKEGVLKMARSEDAYGRMMWDLHRGIPAQEIVERDDGLISAGKSCAYFEPFGEWPPHHRESMDHVSGRVLDIGCGPGRHAIHLQQEGFDVLGIDASPLAIQVARERGLRKAGVLNVTRISFRLGEFDTLLMMGNNFGLFGNLKRARWLLRKMRNMTSSNGRIIAESRDPYTTTSRAHLDYHESNRRRGKFPGQLRMRIRYERYIGAWFEYLIVSRKEMALILEDTGWRISRFIPETGSIYVAIIDRA
ncbi:MAG: methyltransferase domain-containing protein [Gemmatimonadota bacterium]|nr:methyltransferase domain-containing protein [Gemmatimonadota bacterium]